jgi:hypothetical protein
MPSKFPSATVVGVTALAKEVVIHTQTISWELGIENWELFYYSLADLFYYRAIATFLFVILPKGSAIYSRFSGIFSFSCSAAEKIFSPLAGGIN